VWDPSGQGIVFVAWPFSPLNFPASARKLGVVFCFNRPSLLYYVPYLPVVPAVKGSSPGGDASKAAAQPAEPQAVPQAVKLSGGLLSALQPVFTPNGSTLVFLSQQAAVNSGVHNATSSLHTIDWQQWCSSSEAATAAVQEAGLQLLSSSRSSDQAAAAAKQAVAAAVQGWNTWAGQQGSTAVYTVVDVVKRPSQPGGFPGLYATAVVDNPWAGPKQLLLNSQWYSQTAVVCVDLGTGAVNPVTPTGAAAGSWVLQGVANGVAACISSTPQSPPQVMLAAVPAGGNSSTGRH
jgi:acylaminoacyl-peptidase